MRKLLSFLVAGVMFGACSKGVDSEFTKEDVTRLVTTEDYTVPVKNDQVTIVKVGEDTIAVAYSEFPILVPKGVKLDVSYADIDKSSGKNLARGGGWGDEWENGWENEIGVGANKSQLFQVICFEDSQKLDYDYNDLVIHVKYQQMGNFFGFGVQPVALGSTKDIRLGYKVYKGDILVAESLISEYKAETKGMTCREQMFNIEGVVQKGILNVKDSQVNFKVNRTYLGSTIRSWDISKLEGNGAMRVEWFIEVDGGTRLYALSTGHLKQSLDEMGLPYGLVITETGITHEEPGKGTVGKDWFNYPQESQSMESVYPEIWKWMIGEKPYEGTIYEEGKINCPAGAFKANESGVYVIKDNPTVYDKNRQN